MSTRLLTGRAPLLMLEAYWEGLRNGRLVPSRNDIQPNGLGAAIDHAFLVERVASGFARLRVAGTRLNDLLGMETRGMPISSLFIPEDRSELADTLESVFSHPAIAELTLDDRGDSTRPALMAEMLLLPLRDNKGHLSRALGCCVYDGQIGVPPRRFRLLDVHTRALPQPGQHEHPEGHDRHRPQVVQPGFAEVGNGFDPAPRPRRRLGRPNLRLVKSDETADKN